MRYMNVNSKICNFSMKERSNEGMMQGRNVKKVTFFVSLKEGLYIYNDCMKILTVYILQKDIYKRYMIAEMYTVRKSFKKGMYVNSYNMKYSAECMYIPTICNCCLYVITILLNNYNQITN